MDLGTSELINPVMYNLTKRESVKEHTSVFHTAAGKSATRRCTA